jgi:hypothetical protein
MQQINHLVAADLTLEASTKTQDLRRPCCRLPGILARHFRLITEPLSVLTVILHKYDDF